MTTIAESKEEITTLGGLRDYFVAKVRDVSPNPVLYDLGCGRKRSEGFLGVDKYSATDVRADLFADEWTFTPDNSVDMFYSSHLLEHVPDLNKFMTNAWKKLKPMGYFLISVPYGFSVRAWQDPTHIRPIFRETFWYFNKIDREKMGVEEYEGCEADFIVADMWPVWNKRFAARAMANPDLAEQFLSTFNAVDDLTVLLRARK